jgi:long-chain acyl-CoA synthetase
MTIGASPLATTSTTQHGTNGIHSVGQSGGAAPGDVPNTLPKLLARNAAKCPRDIALREKQFGIWRTYTWAEYQANVKRRALGLHAIGVKRGDVVGLIGNNRPDWVFGELAAHALGAISLGIYRDALDEEVAYLASYADVRIMFVEDEEQVDKVLSLGDRFPEFGGSSIAIRAACGEYGDSRLLSIAGLDAFGDELASQPKLYEELVGVAQAKKCNSHTTSGTTSSPVGNAIGRAVDTSARATFLSIPGTNTSMSPCCPALIMEQVYALEKR